jgi:hypothetical protein
VEERRAVRVRCCHAWLAASLVPLALIGCRKENAGVAGGGQPATVDPERIEAVRDAMTRGMREMDVDELTTKHAGMKCVVTARVPAGGYQPDPPPPPPGMVQLLGQTVIYSGEFDWVSSDSLAVRAAYPAGHYKKIEILRSDIRSVHLGR